MLLGTELLDELTSAVPSAGAPAIQETFATSYAATAGVLLLIPALVALLLEPIIFLAADRWPRRHFVRGGLCAMALSALASALAPGPITLALAVGLVAVSSGTAVALSQATLIDLHPQARERIMTRWALMGELGDLVGPLLLAGLAAVGLGWRAGYAVVAALLAVWALASLRPFPQPPGGVSAEPEADEPSPGLFASLLVALRDRRLLFWLGAAAFCDLLDEVLVVFASLHLRDRLGAGPTERAVALTLGTVGAAAGVLYAERLLARHAPMKVLAGFAGACLATYFLWLAAPTWWLSALGLFFVGATASPLYPITAAQAYAALPGRSGTVNAAGHLFTPLAMALPWVLGRLADRAGTLAALLVLAAEPLVLFAVALAMGRNPRRFDDR